MYYFVEIACVISEIWMIHWLLKGMFPYRDLPKWVCPTLYGCYCAVLIALSFARDASFLRIMLNFGIIWFLGGFVFQSNLVHSLFVSIMICALAAFSDVLVSSLFLHFQFQIEEFMNIGPQRSLYLIATHIVLFAFSACISSVSTLGRNEISIKQLVLVLPCWLCSVLLCLILAWQMLGEKTISPLYLLVLLGMLYTDMLFVYQIRKLSTQEREKREGKLAEHHYAMQQAYYDQFRIQQEETRALWHDISKFLRAAKLEGSNEALNQVEQMLHSIGTVVDVDNRVVSVILNEYAQEAAKADIRLEMDVHVPRELPISAVDLYILLGNTLENAIEACCALLPEERKITIKLKMHNRILFYSIENPYDPSYPERIRGELHGYGLQNVRRCVEKYQGNIEIQKQNNVFCLIAHLNT